MPSIGGKLRVPCPFIIDAGKVRSMTRSDSGCNQLAQDPECQVKVANVASQWSAPDVDTDTENDTASDEEAVNQQLREVIRQAEEDSYLADESSSEN